MPTRWRHGPPSLVGLDILQPERTGLGAIFRAVEEEAAYVAWLRAKVAASLADPRPPVPHDEAMAEIRAIIEMKRSGKTC